MFSYVLLAALLVFTNANPAVVQRGGRIFGGEDTTIEEHPYMVSIQLEGSHYCGGSIVSDRWVLTALHCMGDPMSHYEIKVGSAKYNEGQVYKADLTISYENKSFDLGNDIALVRTTKAFEFGPTVQPIELAEPGKKSEAGTEAVVTGWGHTKRGIPEVLQKVTVPVIDREVCEVAYKFHGGVPEDQFCAGLHGIGGKDACQADSGGPLVIQGRQAGIVSWGYGCGQPNFPGVYTDIAYYSAWVDEKIKDVSLLFV